MQHTTETPKQYQCRHIFTDGHRCASPCLRKEEFCYYHHTTRKPIANSKQRRSRRSAFHLLLPEDRSAIQASIGEVLQRIASNDIDPRRAGLLLYGLQIASLNLPKIQTAKAATEPQTVEEITNDPTLGVLAPRTEVSGITQRKSPVAQLIERLMQDEQEAADPNINEVAAEPAIVPILQAAENNPEIGVPLNAIPNNWHFDRSQPKERHFDRSEAKWRNPLLHLSSPKTLTRGSCIPSPPERRAYRQSWR
jgi:hypothetical protein